MEDRSVQSSASASKVLTGSENPEFAWLSTLTCRKGLTRMIVGRPSGEPDIGPVHLSIRLGQRPSRRFRSFDIYEQCCQDRRPTFDRSVTRAG